MKACKKTMILLLLISVLSSTAMAAERADQTPILSFNGTTADCSVQIRARGKYIDATLELWQGSTMVDSWHNSGYNSVYIHGTHSNCTPGVTYTLIVTGTIGGVAITCTPVTGSC